jgi:hypothetical protein
MKNERRIQMEKIEVGDLVIECTRRCNASCAHCLRGNAQKRDMDIEHVIGLFSQIKSINYLTLSGGEPSLVPNKIFEILEIAKKFDVAIDNFHMFTNGLNVSKEFLHSVLDFYLYCNDNKCSGVELSQDQYHPKVPNRNLEELSSLSFFRYSDDDDNYLRTHHLLNEGRAKKLGAWKNTIVATPYISKQHGGIVGLIYLNCKGKIVKSCDLSYRSQDRFVNILCKASDSLKDFIEVI